jgi:c-di-GMP-binding flagellar brake protein YcgR
MMAIVFKERRRFSRKHVKLSCSLQIGSGMPFRGFTRDLSQEGAMVEFQHLPSMQQNTKPKTGDRGSLTLRYHKQSTSESMKIGCRVMHTQANRIGLLLYYLKMSDLDKQSLDQILNTESGNI